MIIWECPDCTWFRARTDSREWANRIIDHPTLGPIRNGELYVHDIVHHDCELTRRQRIKHHMNKPKSPSTRLMIERKVRV